MRTIFVYAGALAMVACAVPDSTVVVNAAYGEETERVIQAALVAGSSVRTNANQEYRAAIARVDRRIDGADRIVARAEQLTKGPERSRYIAMLSQVGVDSTRASDFLLKTALAKPADPPKPLLQSSRDHLDIQSDYERDLGEMFAAATQLVLRGEEEALHDIYASADLNVAAVAAVTAANHSMLDSRARDTLSSRGITGTFEALPMLTVPGVRLGPNSVVPPGGPQ